MSRKDEAQKIIKKHVYFSMGSGLIPIPLLDLATLTGVQLNMLRKIAEIYETPFSRDKVKNLIAPLVGVGSTVTLANTLTSVAKFIPVIGQAAGALSMPITAGATTYALGKVFVQHFASGGTFLSFDPDKVKDYYSEMFKKGQQEAADIQKSDEFGEYQ